MFLVYKSELFSFDTVVEIIQILKSEYSRYIANTLIKLVF